MTTAADLVEQILEREASFPVGERAKLDQMTEGLVSVLRDWEVHPNRETVEAMLVGGALLAHFQKAHPTNLNYATNLFETLVARLT